MATTTAGPSMNERTPPPPSLLPKPMNKSPAFIPPRSSSHGASAITPPRVSSLKSAGKRPAPSSSRSPLAFGPPLPSIPSVSSIAASSSTARRPKSIHEADRIHGTALEFGSSSRQALLHMSPGKPPQEPSKTIGDDLIQGVRPTWTSEKEKILLGPFDFLFGHPGKDIRSQTINAFNQWLKVPQDRLEVITKAVGMLHTASLLVDDVEDSSHLRRGEPVAHNIFGVPQVINSANYVYFLALQELSTLRNPEIIQIFSEELINLHRGQGMDLFWRDTLTCPTENDYLEMVNNKTGGLFRLAIKLMEAESTALRAPSATSNGTNGTSNSTVGLTCVPLINTIGLQFQILDDLLNLSSPAYTARKGLAEDLTEGKFSFPVIHAIRSEPGNMVLINILRQKTTDAEVKRYAIEFMERTGSFEYTRKVIAELEKKAIAEVERLEGLFVDGKQGADVIKIILGKLKAL